MDDESKQMHVDSLNVQVSNHQSLKDYLPVIKHAGSSGNGFPYAPEDFPSPGDVWTWRVGKRCTHAGFWQDRSVHPPDRLQSSMGGKMSFRGRASLEQYIRKTFPDANVDALFDSFVWRIPCTNVAKDASLKATKSKGCSKFATAIIRPGNCKASNEMCRIKAETGSSLTPATCKICCSEPNFCRYCCCILCSKTIDWIYDGYSFIKCEALVDEKFICGHVAHIECALRAYLAGKVGGSIDLDAHYYCRCCDNRTDLLLHVEKIIKVSESIDNRDDMVKVLNLGFCMLRGSEKERAGKLRNHIATSVEKLKHGVPSEDIWKKRSEISELEQGSMGRSYNYDHLKKSSRSQPSYFEPNRGLDSGRQSGQEREGRDRGDDRGKSYQFEDSSSRHESKSQSSHHKDVDPHPAIYSGGKSSSHASTSVTVPVQHSGSSDAQPSSELRSGAGSHDTSFRRHDKHTLVAPTAPVKPPTTLDATAAERMAALKVTFPNICFDGFDYVPALRLISSETQDRMLSYVSDVFDQHRTNLHLIESISEVSMKRKNEIDCLTLLKAQDKETIKHLDEEVKGLNTKLADAEKRAIESSEAVERMKKEHQIELDAAICRSGILALEKDAMKKDNDALAFRIQQLEEELEKEKKEKIEAQQESQKYCKEIVEARMTKKEAEKKLKQIETLEEEAKEAGREEIKDDFDPLLIYYNASVLLNRNLRFLGEGYPESLVEAWDYIVELKKTSLGGAEVDEEQLMREILRDEELDELKAARLSLFHGPVTTEQEKGGGEASGSSSRDPLTSQATGASASHGDKKIYFKRTKN